PDIAVRQTASAGNLSAGSEYPFEVTVANQGQSDALGTKLRLELPLAGAFTSIVPPFGFYGRITRRNGRTGVDVGRLAAGESLTFMVHVRADTPGALSHVASVSTISRESDRSNNTDTKT